MALFKFPRRPIILVIPSFLRPELLQRIVETIVHACHTLWPCEVFTFQLIVAEAVERIKILHPCRRRPCFTLQPTLTTKTWREARPKGRVSSCLFFPVEVPPRSPRATVANREGPCSRIAASKSREVDRVIRSVELGQVGRVRQYSIEVERIQPKASIRFCKTVCLCRRFRDPLDQTVRGED